MAVINYSYKPTRTKPGDIVIDRDSKAYVVRQDGIITDGTATFKKDDAEPTFMLIPPEDQADYIQPDEQRRLAALVVPPKRHGRR